MKRQFPSTKVIRYRLEWHILAILLFILNACQNNEWKIYIPQAGTYSSPKAVDLNGDGIKDIVLGAGGKKEWEASENGVLAFNGKNGELLWKISCRNQVVGSPIFQDITADGIADVFIGGRSAQFFAIDGRKGELLWEYLPHSPQTDYLNDTSILNFFTPALIPDQDNDGIKDLLVSYGGFVKAAPHEHERPAGYLMVFSAKTGKVLAQAPMPDGKETYMSPVVQAYDDNLWVFFGSGGETIAGNFYATKLKDIMDGKIQEHIAISKGKQKGFIAPPALADLNKDDKQDIVINAFEGKVLAFEGETFDLLWQVNLGSEYETHAMPCIEDFTSNGELDVFVNFGKGTWPEIESAVQILINGSTGKHYFLDSIGSIQYASPVIFSSKSKKGKQIIYPINNKEATKYAPELGLPEYNYEVELSVFNNQTASHKIIAAQKGINIGSTPLIDDLDGDGKLEVIFIINHIKNNPFVSEGITVKCITFQP